MHQQLVLLPVFKTDINNLTREWERHWLDISRRETKAGRDLLTKNSGEIKCKMKDPHTVLFISQHLLTSNRHGVFIRLLYHIYSESIYSFRVRCTCNPVMRIRGKQWIYTKYTWRFVGRLTIISAGSKIGEPSSNLNLVCYVIFFFALTHLSFPSSVSYIARQTEVFKPG